MTGHLQLSRREREIVDILYRRGERSAADVRRAMREPPSDSAVRTLLRLLVEKGHVRHRRQGRRFLYSPTVPPSRARRSALRHVVQTFFDGSVEKTVASILDAEAARLSPEELERLASMIRRAQKDKKE